VAFVGVTVIPMSGPATIANQTVIVRDGKVAQIGDSARVAIPAGALVVPASRKYLMPGLAEMHAHIPGANAPRQLIEDILFLYIANGITTIRGMLGAPNQLELRSQTASGALLGPTIIVGAPSLNGNTAPNAEAASRLVREHKAAGYDFLKLHPGLSRAAYDAIVATSREVGITYGGHVSSDVGIRHTLASSQSTVDHIDAYLEEAIGSTNGNLGINANAVRMLGKADSATMHALAVATRTAGIWVVPTEYLWENFFVQRPVGDFMRLPEMRYVPQSMKNGWMNQKLQFDQGVQAANLTPSEGAQFVAARRLMLRELAREGNRILMGTDSPQMMNVPGFALGHEIRVMHEAGMSPQQVLESGTRNVSRYVEQHLKGDSQFGTVAVGQRADLVLLDGNPLADLANLEKRAGVMVRGRWVPAEELRRGLEAMAARNRTP
jgi:imidazolonepropionase-like amidohydrolase